MRSGDRAAIAPSFPLPPAAVLLFIAVLLAAACTCGGAAAAAGSTGSYSYDLKVDADGVVHPLRARLPGLAGGHRGRKMLGGLLGLCAFSIIDCQPAAVGDSKGGGGGDKGGNGGDKAGGGGKAAAAGGGGGFLLPVLEAIVTPPPSKGKGK